jgi:hypothetical protein
MHIYSFLGHDNLKLYIKQVFDEIFLSNISSDFDSLAIVLLYINLYLMK